ncbi:MAG: bifunctional proline dehydrogenase/L-glutamate gamma-semialdehyde dehydrogenase PutA [Pseudomonadota bacterium]
MFADLAEPAPTTAGPLAKAYLMNEGALIETFLEQIELSETERAEIQSDAETVVAAIRMDRGAQSQVDHLLQEYGLSTDEGVILMRLAEALIRTPDFVTARTLVRDKIGAADWAAHRGQSDSVIVNQATTGLRFTAQWIRLTGGTKAAHLLAKLGDRVMAGAMSQAMSIMGNHFVLGRTIQEAAKRARTSEAKGIAHSYDMLGEAAHTMADAERYYGAYVDAIEFLADEASTDDRPHTQPGLSVKLSALHPRYEYAARDACVPVLMERVGTLARIAAKAGLWLNIDAEEADRLELSLVIFERLLNDPALADWPGLGLVVQAYQRRAGAVIDHISALAETKRRNIAVRLVKGAYWDMEIKRAQVLGLSDYPVFTRKENTDLSYLFCAQKLLRASARVFPQFATHNAHTALAIMRLAGSHRKFEFQRLHGMGTALHDRLTQTYGVPSRIYAPVGSHKDLLPYLVRRLLENGANGSFVNQMMDDEVPLATVAEDPISKVLANRAAANPLIPAPRDTVGPGRRAAIGIDLSQASTAHPAERCVQTSTDHRADSLIAGAPIATWPRDTFSPQDQRAKVGTIGGVDADTVDAAIASAGQSDWAASKSPSTRATILQTAADLLEQEMPEFLELCVREAGKTLPDAVAEVREAVDFCRYYALQAQAPNFTSRAPLGVVGCISPWNFPLAIFLGQVVAALSVGNTVIAKPAPQTPIIAVRAVELLYRAGVPKDALHVLLGDGAALGTAITRHDQVRGICFTGSTKTAKAIAKTLADTGRGDTPFIAETGGINVMIVDSTALLEQAVQDVIDSAFQSAGQRCSACRIVCVQDEIADDFWQMLTGAMETLTLGDPARLSTDVGPVIDRPARDRIESYIDTCRPRARNMFQARSSDHTAHGFFVAPTVLEMASVADVQQEVFGPILHFVRFKSTEFNPLIDAVNALGFGLTMGLHTRLDERVAEASQRARVGNLYVNRNQIGAVVGVQPFGGEGLSGTGPKAGGPNYLYGFTQAARVPASEETPEIGERLSRRAQSVDATDILRIAKQSSAVWAAKSWAQRKSILHPLMDQVRFGPDEGFALNAIEDLQPLPGPTGEENTLHLCPKGVCLCFGGQPSTLDTVAVLKALMAGSSVIYASDWPGALADLQAGLKSLPVPLAKLVQFVSYETGLSLIDLPIDGVAADGDTRAAVAKATCRRSGPILPLLSASDPIARFFHERTLTVNTTAAGGNATLLALS